MHNSLDVPVPGLQDAVVVTGAGSGIGAATARRLGTAGAPVVLVGRREGPLREVALWITLLLSPAAAFMTGAVIPLDGGQVIDRELESWVRSGQRGTAPAGGLVLLQGRADPGRDRQAA